MTTADDQRERDEFTPYWHTTEEEGKEVRQDDDRRTGWCPTCGEQTTTTYVDGSGWCPDHGRVFQNWEPPKPGPHVDETGGIVGPFPGQAEAMAAVDRGDWEEA